jgi:hypothetical protein
MIECIAQLLLMARGGCEEGAPDPRPPWFSSRVIVETVYSLSGVGSREEQKRQLWSKVSGTARYPLLAASSPHRPALPDSPLSWQCPPARFPCPPPTAPRNHHWQGLSAPG